MSTKSNSSLPISPSAHSSQNSSRPTHQNTRSSSFFTYPVNYAVSGILRRLNTDSTSKSDTRSRSESNGNDRQSGMSSLSHSFASFVSSTSDPPTMNSAILHSPRREHSPFQPPPLTPLCLSGYKGGMREEGKLLSTALAEEIRLLVPPRLQLVDEWTLAYSLEQNGVSLATLYQTCEDYRGKRGGFVLVVKDGDGGVRSTRPRYTKAAILTYENRSLAHTSPTHHTHPLISTVTANASSGVHTFFPRYPIFQVYHHLLQRTLQMPYA